MRMIERGLVSRRRLQYLPYGFQESKEIELGIGLVDVGALFIYLCISLIISVIIFCLELFSWNHQVKNQHNKF